VQPIRWANSACDQPRSSRTSEIVSPGGESQSGSSAVLGGLDDLIVTGVRGTNVRDLRLIYVGGAALGTRTVA
jgi:hypothetical protein